MDAIVHDDSPWNSVTIGSVPGFLKGQDEKTVCRSNVPQELKVGWYKLAALGVTTVYCAPSCGPRFAIRWFSLELNDLGERDMNEKQYSDGMQRAFTFRLPTHPQPLASLAGEACTGSEKVLAGFAGGKPVTSFPFDQDLEHVV